LPTVQPRFWAIILVITFFVVAGVVAVASSGNKQNAVKPTPLPTPIITPPPADLTFTVKSGVGIATVKVTDQNTGSTIILTPVDLPASFTFKNGDTITFTVTSQAGYRFNAWVLGDGSFQSQNPYSVKPVSPLTLEARFLMTG
jgi:hypothetical protein